MECGNKLFANWRKTHTTENKGRWQYPASREEALDTVIKGAYVCLSPRITSISLEPNEKEPEQNLVRAHYLWAIFAQLWGDMKSPEEHFKRH